MKYAEIHIIIIFSIFSLTLLIIDKVNDAMYFINNNIYKNMLIIFFVYELTKSIWKLISLAKRNKL